jgi:hypothetical protein
MEQVRPLIEDESLVSLLRTNLAGHLGKEMTRDALNELASQIIESIDYKLRNPEDKFKGVCL